MAIQTTDDFRTWWIEPRAYSTEELRDYIQSLAYNKAGDIRVLTINFVDKVIVINGIPMTCIGSEELAEKFDKVAKPYSSNGGVPVTVLHFYTDRQIIEVEYGHHPLDPKPMNSQHESKEFKTLFSDLFAVWKADRLGAVNAQLEAEKEYRENIEVEGTFTPAD